MNDETTHLACRKGGSELLFPLLIGLLALFEERLGDLDPLRNAK